MPHPTAIWLRRHEDTVEVLGEFDGKWRLMITEYAEAPFSYITELTSREDASSYPLDLVTA